MSVPIRHSVSPVAVGLVGLAVVVVIVLLGMIYGELHYRNCLGEAQLAQQAQVAGIGPAKWVREPAYSTSDCSRLPL